MNVADILLLLAVLLFTLRGFSRGLARELLGIVGFVGGLAVAIALTPVCSAMLEASFTLPSVVAVGATFAFFYSIVSLAAGWTGGLLRHPAAGISKVFRAILGAILGGLKATAVIGLLVFFADVFHVSPRLDNLVAGSLFVRPLVASSQALFRVNVAAVTGAFTPPAEQQR